MIAVSSLNVPLSAPRFSLVETVTQLRSEFQKMQQELGAARDEINRLRRKLARQRLESNLVPDLNTAELRRRAAFYCHPDRVGDNALMSDLNVLIDYIDQIKNPGAGAPQATKTGAAQ